MKNNSRNKYNKLLLVASALTGIAAGTTVVNALDNMKKLNKTIDKGMNILSGHGEVIPVDAGEYSRIRLFGLMNFRVSQHYVKNLGNLSVMKMNMGLMQMASFVITPYEKDMPLFSADIMYICGKHRTYIEFCDLVKDVHSAEYAGIIDKLSELKEKYSSLEDMTSSPAWYDNYLSIVLLKSGTSADDDELKSLFCDSVKYYMEAASGLRKLSYEEKKEKSAMIQEYSDSLIYNGGISTDVFKKAFGEEKTKDFYDKVFFGTELA